MYIYHGTHTGAVISIQRDGRMRLKAVNDEPYISFTSKINVAEYYANMKGGMQRNGEILRTELTDDFSLSPKFKKNDGHEWITTKQIPVAELEILTKDKNWIPLSEWDYFTKMRRIDEATEWGKAASAASRFRPAETIEFDPPIIGTNGAQLISYQWSYEWSFRINREGDAVDTRISDWTQAELSAETGRDIVHKFTVKRADGQTVTVSAETVPVLLGYVDRAQVKGFGSLVGAVKTLAKQQMQLAILEAQQKEYDDFKAELEKTPKPQIEAVPASIESLPFAHRKAAREGRHDINTYTEFKMGDVTYWQDNPHKYDSASGKVVFTRNETPTKDTIESLTYSWIQKRMNQAGIKAPYGLYDLKRRIERQKRKVEQLTNSKLTESASKHRITESDNVKIINWKTHKEPLRDSDRIRVFHGFNSYSIDYALAIVKHGLSGQVPARRLYSYETVNNPKGFFVSIDFHTVQKNFAGSGIIIEIDAEVKELEAPVWKGQDSYFVQGQYTQGFENDEERQQEILRKRKKYQDEDPEEDYMDRRISKSDRPELAQTLFNNAEFQALFVGNLNPDEIKYVWFNEVLFKERRTNGEWKRYSRHDFLEMMNQEIEKRKKDDTRYDSPLHKAESKIFSPNEDFSEAKLQQWLDDKGYGDIENFLTITIEDPYLFNDHFYPKQIAQVKQYMKDKGIDKTIEKLRRGYSEGVTINNKKQMNVIDKSVKLIEAMFLKELGEQPKKKSLKPKNNAYGISKECKEFLIKKGYKQLTAWPQTFVSPKEIIFNPALTADNKDKVWVCKFPFIQKDGSKGYRTAYTMKYRKQSSIKKYKKISKISTKDIGAFEEKTIKLMQHKDKAIADAACVIRIILKTGLRIGSLDSSANPTGNLGVRTLKAQNIKVHGTTVDLEFVGKEYQINTAQFDDAPVAAYLKKTISKKRPQDNVFDCSYSFVGKMMKKINPKKINPKDLRTYKAGDIAQSLLSKTLDEPLPDNPKEIKKIVKERLRMVFVRVAEILNNTPAMAKNSYIPPTIITNYLDKLGLEPQFVGYKHITLESIILEADLNINGLEIDLPDWWSDDSVALVKKEDNVTS